MRRNRGYSNAEVVAGVFITFCLGLFVALLFIFGDAARLLRGRMERTVFFTTVTALRPDAPVRFNGVEVGRVKSIDIRQLNEDEFLRLPWLRRGDLDNLPLTDKERAELAKLPEPVARTTARPAKLADVLADNYQNEVRKRVLNRTIIELKLDVLLPQEKEGPGKRYRVDDQVRVNTTLLGDTSIEMASGTGKTLDALTEEEKKGVLLGVSGDFFANLGRSVEQVKELLASVGDVIGDKERESVRKALRRMDPITQSLESTVNLAEKRLPGTLDKVDALVDAARQDVNKVSQAVCSLQDPATKTLGTTRQAVENLEKRLGGLTDEAQATVVEVRKQVKPILDDVQKLAAQTRQELPDLLKSSRDLTDRLKLSADKLDTVLLTGNELLRATSPDLRAAAQSARRATENLEEAGALVKRKPWLILNAPKDDKTAFDKPLEAANKLEVATRQFRELTTELKALRRNLPTPPNPQQLQRLDAVIQSLEILNENLKTTAEAASAEVVPEFRRKHAEFLDVPEPDEIRRPKETRDTE